MQYSWRCFSQNVDLLAARLQTGDKGQRMDLVQAWSLKRSALKAAAAEDDDAAYAWQAAIANDAADPDLFRVRSDIS